MLSCRDTLHAAGLGFTAPWRARRTTAFGAQNLERPQRLLESPPRTRPHGQTTTSVVSAPLDPGWTASPSRRTSDAGRATAPDVRAPLEIVVSRPDGPAPRRSRPGHGVTPIRIGRCSCRPVQTLVLALRTSLHCQERFGRVDRQVSCRPAVRSASCVCGMIAFGLSGLPAPQAGQFTWQRPRSTHVNASSTLFFRGPSPFGPTCSFSKRIEVRRSPSSFDFGTR